MCNLLFNTAKQNNNSRGRMRSLLNTWRRSEKPKDFNFERGIKVVVKCNPSLTINWCNLLIGCLPVGYFKINKLILCTIRNTIRKHNFFILGFFFQKPPHCMMCFTNSCWYTSYILQKLYFNEMWLNLNCSYIRYLQGNSIDWWVEACDWKLWNNSCRFTIL